MEQYLREHLKKYPYMQPQDIVKLCYQAARGAEHLLKDEEAARRYFEEEYAQVPAQEGLLFEKISPDVCRVNMAAWKSSGMPSEWLFRMFVMSTLEFNRREHLLEEYLDIADRIVRTESMTFSPKKWDDYIESYKLDGMPATHHSSIYRNCIHPAYRIVNTRCLCILPILEKAAKISGKDEIKIIALEGRAASGKTTRAGMLSAVLSADVVHMDDFFLPPAMRSKERLEEPGGNVHYERFADEVLPYLKRKTPFSYRCFSCRTMDYDGMREIGSGEWRIVEGSYCLHPKFENYADLKVFCDVDEEEQMRRILERNGPDMAKMFRMRWIPMEEAYFNSFGIKDSTDLVAGN